MNNDSQLNDLLDRWEEARENGEPISLEELCRDHPALLTSMTVSYTHLTLPTIYSV